MAAYRACLHAAGFDLGTDTIRFQGNREANALSGLDPSRGLSGDEAERWFTAVWDNYRTDPYFVNYPANNNGREWADDDEKALLVMLTRKRTPGGDANYSGFRKLVSFRNYHTSRSESSFERDIVRKLRAGEIVIIDLSQGDPVIQATYSEKICSTIFSDAMSHFVQNRRPNFVQMFFEEAHNLFPKKDDKDLSQIYNRIAKEGAKLKLGLVYATQEVSSISANVLKNTQNWFVSHLNNRDELREVEKFYDFADFTESLRRVSDRGFIRMKVYSNAFIVPVQIDRFSVKTEGS